MPSNMWMMNSISLWFSYVKCIFQVVFLRHLSHVLVISCAISGLETVVNVVCEKSFYPNPEEWRDDAQENRMRRHLHHSSLGMRYLQNLGCRGSVVWAHFDLQRNPTGLGGIRKQRGRHQKIQHWATELSVAWSAIQLCIGFVVLAVGDQYRDFSLTRVVVYLPHIRSQVSMEGSAKL